MVLFAYKRVYTEDMRIWTIHQAPREGLDDLFAASDTLDSIFTESVPFDADRVNQIAVDVISQFSRKGEEIWCGG
ncbi:hypothetical protein HBI66_152810 [Parastagonospora nodorum]|nr:hypothetical protein HBI66_152810 [Parastagonospora nodorum]